MAPYIRYGENDSGRTRHPNKHKKRTRWHQKHRVITVPSKMNNYTDIHYFYDIDDPYSNLTNASTSVLSNHFYRKKLMLGDMSARRSAGAQPLTTVIVIASIFLFITMSITAATIVFCKKKNTVFVLNKSEQDENDYDLELEELDNTDVDFVELNEEFDLAKMEQQPSTSRRFREEKHGCRYEQDGYRRMVVTAMVEHENLETPRKHGIYKTSSTSDSDLSLNEASSGYSKHGRLIDYQKQIDSSRGSSQNPENVKELLKCLPLGAQTIQYINGKRYLVCELPEQFKDNNSFKNDNSSKNNNSKDVKNNKDLYSTRVDIEPGMSSIQGELSPHRNINHENSFHESEEELICDGLNDPYLSLGMTHSQSMGVIMNPNHEHNLRMSMSTDFDIKSVQR